MFIRPATVQDLEILTKRCVDACDREGWERGWTEGGCYLHLEASEFIESIRGKKGEPKLEAADILFVLLSIMAHHNVKIEDVLNSLDNFLTNLETVKA